MEELKAIWKKANELQLQIERLLPKEDLKGITHLTKEIEEKEKERKIVFKKTQKMLISTFFMMLTIIVTTNLFIGYSITLIQIIGFLFVALAMFYFLYSYHQNTLKIEKVEPTEEFVQNIIQLYRQRKQLLFTRPIIYTIFLMGGIILILWNYLQLIPGYLGIIGALLGVMFGLTGVITAMEKKKFDQGDRVILEQLLTFQAS